MALLVVVSLFQVPLAAASGQTAPPPEDETFEVTDQVSAWERSFLPLRADTDDAAETVPNADWRARSPGGQEANLNRDPIAVYEPGSSVELTFDLSDANANSGTFGNQEVEVLRMHLDEDRDQPVPDTFSGALDMMTRENASDNAEFKEVDGSATLDANGDLSFEDTTPESGHYFYVVALKNSGDGFSVSDGDLRIDGDVTVIGMEQVAVRKSAGSVSHPDEVKRGETVSFDVNASSIEGDTVRQAIVLYDEEKFIRQSFVVDVSGGVGSEFDPNTNTTLETTIDGVNGVASLENSVGVMGISIGDGQIARTAGIESLMDFVGEEAESSSSNAVDISNDDVVLDASVTAVSGSNGDTTIDVETFKNWSTGDYRWAYVAVGNSSQEMVTQTGHVEITKNGDKGDDKGDKGDDKGDKGDDKDDEGDDKDDEGDEGDDGNEGDEGDEGDEGNEGDNGDDENEGDDGDDNEGNNGNGNNAGGAGGGAPSAGGGGGVGPSCDSEPTIFKNDDAADAVVDCVNTDTGITMPNLGLSNGPVTLDRLNVSAFSTDRNVRVEVTARESMTGSTPPLAEEGTPLGYFEVSTQNLTSPDMTPGTFTFQVSNETLDSQGILPEDVVLYRYHDDSWNPVETAHVGGETYRATTPGFSMFAVGTEYASLTVTDTSLSATEIEAGETVDVTVTVENTGVESGTMSVPITVNGDERATADISVDGGESVSETVSLTLESAGEYDVAVDGADAGTIAVSAMATDTPSTVSAGDSDDSTATQADDSDGDADDGETEPPATTAQDFQEENPDTAGPDGDSEAGFPLIVLGIVVVLAALAGIAFYLRN